MICVNSNSQLVILYQFGHSFPTTIRHKFVIFCCYDFSSANSFDLINRMIIFTNKVIYNIGCSHFKCFRIK